MIQVFALDTTLHESMRMHTTLGKTFSASNLCRVSVVGDLESQILTIMEQSLSLNFDWWRSPT